MSTSDQRERTDSAYQSLRGIIAEGTRPIVIWVGAGISRQAGLPSWAELREALARMLAGRVSEQESGAYKEKVRGQLKAANEAKTPWVAFEILEDALGKTTFREEIRALLSAVVTDVPSICVDIWRLKPRIVLTTNLDRFLMQGWVAQKDTSSPAPLEYEGRSIARLRDIYSKSERAIGYLHGRIENHDSWIFTNRSLSALLKDEVYTGFLESVLSTATNIFLGISADDTAVGGHLQRLTQLQVEMPAHYWMTSRPSEDMESWAEANGIRIIRYETKQGDHSALSDLIEDLVTFKSMDDPFPPPAVQTIEASTVPSLPAVDDLVMTSSENEIRQLLNQHARYLLADRSPEAYAAFKDFAVEYDRAIHRAWYVPSTGKGHFFDYKIEQKVATGAFGTVYRARSLEGELVAIKVLRHEIHLQPGALEAFRRGVASMKILTASTAPGLVEYVESTEIPAAVVMRWIEGPTLAEAAHAGYLDTWSDVLRVSRRMCEIVNFAHRLPERVLHRDMRPSNVMLDGYWIDPEDFEMIVLDFDLSWHEDAPEKSVLHATVSGYLAPEQLSQGSGHSTRQAAVDAYGIAMTMYFLLAHQDPSGGISLAADWPETLERVAHHFGTSRWQSLPDRFARLIRRATDVAPSRRPDLVEIIGELFRLERANLDGWSDDVELVAEELACRIPAFHDFSWNEDLRSAEVRRPTGLILDLHADIGKNAIALQLGRGGTGTEERSGFSKYLKKGLNSAVDALTSSGWEVESDREYASAAVRATLPLSAVRNVGLDDSATVIGDSISYLSGIDG